MPRSFMIAHRRTVQDTASIHSHSSNSIDDSRHEKMIRDSCPRDQPRTHQSPVTASSPVSRKQAILQRQSQDKYASVSDGESDSGCSTLTDSRHELTTELDYSWDCPSELSLLMELMTRSPHKTPCRDLSDAASGTKVKKLTQEDFDTAGRRSEGNVIRSEGNVMRSEDSQVVYVRRGEERMLLLSPAEAPRFAATNKYECFEQVVPGLWPKDYPDTLSRMAAPRQEVHTLRDTQIYPRATPEFHSLGHNDHESKPYYAQRRISFDGAAHNSHPQQHRTESERRQESQVRPESPSEEPIDYSQLSTRRKDSIQDAGHHAPQDLSLRHAEQRLEEPSAKIQRMTVETDYDTTRQAKPRPKFEFILSPKIDDNGNVVLGHPGAGSEIKEPSPPLVHANLTALESKHDVFKTESSPMSVSTASPPPIGPVSDVPRVKLGASRYASDNSQVPYHPKLKYLLAASQYAKARVQQEEEEDRKHTPSLASHSPYTPHHQQSVLFTHNQTAQDKPAPPTNNAAPPTNDIPLEGVRFKSESSHFESFPGSQQFQSSSAFTAHNLHNANLFIVNTGSPTDTDLDAKGSNFNESHHQYIEIHPLHIGSVNSLQISSPIVGSCGDGLILREQFHDESVISLSPPPSDQQLSSATARDQQSALSELLFSSNRKTGVDPYACADYGKRYSTSSNLARHRQTHRSVCDKKARKCPHCDKVYVSMPAFSMHVRTHNQGCECPHCGKKFSRPWLLQGHIRTHTGEKPFGCPQCGKSFADKSNLRAHIQTHSTDKPYVCGRCGKAFALKSYLYKHEESSCMRGQRFRE